MRTIGVLHDYFPFACIGQPVGPLERAVALHFCEEALVDVAPEWAGEALPTDARWNARKMLFSEDQPNGLDFEGSAGHVRGTQEDVRNV